MVARKEGSCSEFLLFASHLSQPCKQMIVVGSSHWMPCQAQPNAGWGSTGCSPQPYEDTIF